MTPMTPTERDDAILAEARALYRELDWPAKVGLLGRIQFTRAEERDIKSFLENMAYLLGDNQE